MKSYTNRHGRTVHYDDNGNKTGVSYQSSTGRRVTHYDADGQKTGQSYGDPTRRLVHYDREDCRTGTSYAGSSGYMRHYDAQGNHTADTWKSGFGSTTGPVVQEPVPNRLPDGQPASRTDGSTGCAVFLLLAAAAGLVGLLGAILR